MTPAQKAQFAQELREKLNSRRDVFVVDRFMFEPTGEPTSTEFLGAAAVRYISSLKAEGVTAGAAASQQKTISAAALRLLLDYCESPWDMSFVEYCAGVFQGREPREGETAFDLLPDVQSRLSADRLGLGHIYGSGD